MFSNFNLSIVTCYSDPHQKCERDKIPHFGEITTGILNQTVYILSEYQKLNYTFVEEDTGHV